MKLTIKASIPRCRPEGELRSLVESLVTTALKVATQDWDRNAVKVEFSWGGKVKPMKLGQSPGLFKNRPRGIKLPEREIR